MSHSIVYYAVKKFIAIGEHPEVIIFLPMIKLTKLCTNRFYTPRSSFSTNEILACLRAQPPCVWAGIIINKIFINKDRTSNLLGCNSVACDTAHRMCAQYLAHCVISWATDYLHMNKIQIVCY